MGNTDNKINIGDSWKDLDSIQINIGDAWKDVSEAYINIGDSWKQFWTSAPPSLSYYGTATALSAARYPLTGAQVGNYALFGGGYSGSRSDVVDAYNTSLTRSTPTALSAARHYLVGAQVGNYALFGGGTTGSASDVVDVYEYS